MSPEPLLSARNLAVAYRGRVVLSDASLDVPAGAVTALIGANGAGKTTLVDAMTGFVRPASGHVRLAGREVTGASPDALGRLGLVRVFQEARGFPTLTAVDNVLLGMPLARRERLLSCLDLRPSVRSAERQAIDRAHTLLEKVGLADAAGMAAGELSYGQQKLLCVARGLASGARMLVLDEPSSGASPIALRLLEAAIAQLAADGLCVLLVEHNMELVSACANRVAYLSSGVIARKGTVEEVLTDAEVSRDYLGIAS